jgi:hypothetical protein
LWLADYRLTC